MKTRKDLFYSLFNRRKLIIFTFDAESNDMVAFIEEGLLGDSAFDNGDNEIIIEASGGNGYTTQELNDIVASLEKKVFSANSSLSAHSFNKSSRQDSNFRFTVNDGFQLSDISASSFQQSKWAKFYYDYDDYDSKSKWKTLYIAYEFYFTLDKDFNLKEAYITFIDLNEVQYQVYPENQIDIEDMKKNTPENIKELSDGNMERWGI